MQRNSGFFWGCWAIHQPLLTRDLPLQDEQTRGLRKAARPQYMVTAQKIRETAA